MVVIDTDSQEPRLTRHSSCDSCCEASSPYAYAETLGQSVFAFVDWIQRLRLNNLQADQSQRRSGRARETGLERSAYLKRLGVHSQGSRRSSCCMHDSPQATRAVVSLLQSGIFLHLPPQNLVDLAPSAHVVHDASAVRVSSHRILPAVTLYVLCTERLRETVSSSRRTSSLTKHGAFTQKHSL